MRRGCRRIRLSYFIYLLLLILLAVCVTLKIIRQQNQFTESNDRHFSVAEKFYFGKTDKQAVVSTANILDDLNVNCQAGIEDVPSFNESKIEEDILRSHDRCSYIKTAFGFRNESLIVEERDFPLAYGILAYRDFVQFTFMLSAFYEPQNSYCLALSISADPIFAMLANELPRCFDNIHIITVEAVEYAKFEIIRAVHTCLASLDQQKHDWKYYQYLSGNDLPLRTNFEMVRIMKELQGAPISEISNFQKWRLMWRKMEESPLPLFKSSMSALIPREAAHIIATHPRVMSLLRFLQKTDVPDESFWTTVLGAPELGFEKSWNASAIVQFRQERNGMGLLNAPSRCTRSPCYGGHDQIARFQIWNRFGCLGSWVHTSCSFGIGNLHGLLSSPHLIAHKFHIKQHPAVFFCLLKELDMRRKHRDDAFDYSQYSKIPEVELANGVTLNKLTYPLWI